MPPSRESHCRKFNYLNPIVAEGMESDMVKNAIESAADYLDTRKRRFHCQSNPEKTLSLGSGLCRASNYGRFSACPTACLRYFLQL
jgi:hypothetical protein